MATNIMTACVPVKSRFSQSSAGGSMLNTDPSLCTLDNTLGAFEVAVTVASLLFGGSTFTGFGNMSSSSALKKISPYTWTTVSNGNYLLTCPLGPISVAEFIVNMYAIDGARRIAIYTDQVKIKPYLLAYNSLGAVEDRLLAGTMMLLLLESRTRFKKMNTMITRLVDDVLCKHRDLYKARDVVSSCLTMPDVLIMQHGSPSHNYHAGHLRRNHDRPSVLPHRFQLYMITNSSMFTPVYGAWLFGMLNARNGIRNGTPNNGYSSNEISFSLARSAHTAAAPIQSLSTHSVDAKPSHIMVSVSRETDGDTERSLGKEHEYQAMQGEDAATNFLIRLTGINDSRTCISFLFV
ncbi:uncharacterized protein EV420DRAFT_1634923 [Desarmillaria tabescens]|uniref:Uncharacterized protein n=1 Tax=Armillaria tabescens TaxID=1929756 RepID=A0AA39NRF1_ARMTA|nr:uncharacterized protein EV420DRAFT_1634923 [Desarmillaria tabescens]KAK0470477.1 hypothetical protein EV420DRAFT_1634923 [Desarmillaria tabescens]